MTNRDTFNFEYDSKTDILHVSIGDAKEAVSIEQELEIYVRVDPKTNETVGFTVLGFKSILKKKVIFV